MTKRKVTDLNKNNLTNPKMTIPEFLKKINKNDEDLKGYLDLMGTGITSLPDNLTVGGSLDLEGTGITSLPDNLTVGGSLYLRGTGITALPDNLTVGGSLDLEGTGITSLPDNLTVGGSLYLRGTGITALPDNLTVGGSLYLGGTGITSLPEIINRPSSILSWKGGKYILADGVFAEVVSKKGNVYKLKKVNKDEIMFMVSDGEHCAHGDTIKKAKQDFSYKVMVAKIKKEKIEAETVITIPIYRSLTGACELGVKSWMESNQTELSKLNYSTESGIKAKDLFPLLEKTNAYGFGTFKNLANFI